MSFAHPQALALAFLILPELGLFFLREKRLRASVEALAGARRRSRAGAFFAAFSLWGTVASSLFILSLALSLAGPTWGRKGTTAERRGLEAALVLDVSRSMEAADVAPSRLAAAKALARSLLRSAGADASGASVSLSLVAAKGDAVLLVPMTEDEWALDEALDYADSQALTATGTNLELALRVGLDSFTKSASGNRLLVLFSDGGELEGKAREAAETLRRERVRLLVVGIGGSEPVAVPGADGSPQLDARGLPIHSALEAGKLRALAEAAQGRYLEGADPRLGALLLAELAAARGSGTRIEYESVDRSGLFALAALAFLVAAMAADFLSTRGGRA